MPIAPRGRRLPVGAELVAGGVAFRVWSTRARAVKVVLEGRSASGPSSGGLREVALAAEGDGWFSGVVEHARAGDRYRFRLDDDGTFPDPASRFQPEGPHGPSQVIDPTFAWTDAAWRGRPLEGQIIYELHVGTFTREGTLAAAAVELPELARLGITVVELLPLAEFPGRFGWGYDGVDLFAPTHLYGTPDDLRRFIDAAHGVGIAVILDVVYNHLGPSGTYLDRFSPEYFTDRYPNEWGKALNFDGERSAPVREFFVTNARYWIEELHFDGLRLDATQSIHDASDEHVVAEITRAVRDAAPNRHTLVIAENEPQQARLVRSRARGGYGLDAMWNDDFHHSARVALTGKREAYYQDYRGTPQELVSAIKWGFLFQGQRYRWQNQRRGAPALDVSPAHMVLYLQNHDQIANSACGDRLHRLTSPGRHRAMTALLLLAPGTPMLFQGQEVAASSPVLYFADHEGDLATAVRKGRRDFLMQFPSIAGDGCASRLAPPEDERTFLRSKLDLRERETHAEVYALHEDLLRLRREDRVFHAQRPRGVDGAVLAGEAFLLRYFAERHDDERAVDDRVLLVNLGVDLELDGFAEPLVAPPAGARWQTRWSSDDPRYGGHGTVEVERADGVLYVPAQAAVVLSPIWSEVTSS